MPELPTAVWAHPVFEAAAYLVGGLLYRRARRRQGDVVATDVRWTVVVAAVLGAALGSKLLHHLAAPAEFARQWEALGWPGILRYLSGGKTIVGGLLGGWAAVELAKRVAGIRSRTGDLFALPLTVGIAVGRLGCLFAGPADDTLGRPTAGWWAVDFGDGVGRFPTPLFEILFLAALAAVLVRLRPRLRAAGDGAEFRLFLAAYLGWRFLVDFLKPYEVVLGLRVLQWACLAGLAALLAERLRTWRAGRLG